MVQVLHSCSHAALFDFKIMGLLLDDEESYSGMELREFTVLQLILLPSWKDTVDAGPNVLQDYSYCQYGNDDQSSDTKKILGSVPVCIRSDEGNVMYVCPLIAEGSSQWVIGRKATKRCNTHHIGENTPVLPDSSYTVQLRNVGFHSYLLYEKFVLPSINVSNTYRASFIAKLHKSMKVLSIDHEMNEERLLKSAQAFIR